LIRQKKYVWLVAKFLFRLISSKFALYPAKFAPTADEAENDVSVVSEGLRGA
jgi:hypothetical protein